MIRLKAGVRLYGLQPEMLWALDRAADVWSGFGKNLTVTSTRYNDLHSLKSLHNAGHAVDLRTRDLSAKTRDAIYLLLKQSLGDLFDVVFERSPPHFHVECQPKGVQGYPEDQPF